MRLILLNLTLLIFISSCDNSNMKYTIEWSKEIKEKIIKDANQQPDKTVLDTATHQLTLYKGDIKLKYFMLRPKWDSLTNKIISVDTLVSIFYSTDQSFELVRELCPAIERSFEGIRYKGDHLGLAEFRFCDGKLKEQGCRFDGNVGIWREWDENGKVIKEKDYGKSEKLGGLKDIKYSR